MTLNPGSTFEESEHQTMSQKLGEEHEMTEIREQIVVV
jgi:hypothetical protein